MNLSKGPLGLHTNQPEIEVLMRRDRTVPTATSGPGVWNSGKRPETSPRHLGLSPCETLRSPQSPVSPQGRVSRTYSNFDLETPTPHVDE